jgi:hypothetical protein
MQKGLRKTPVVEKHDVYLEMRLKIEAVFEHYAAQLEYYKRANIAQRFAMEDAFYRLSMELLAKMKPNDQQFLLHMATKAARGSNRSAD